MPPSPLRSSPASKARLIIYHQTIHQPDQTYVSLLPLLAPSISVTHIIIAALHIHGENPLAIHLNDHLPSDPIFAQLWDEARILQQRGVKVMCMLGGAAPGSYDTSTLGTADSTVFRTYYNPLRDLIRRHQFDGIDIDVEQPMSLFAAVRLVNTLRDDFGPDFIITFAPVAAALVGIGNMSGFDYFELEATCGNSIAWYNTQFYNGWGSVDQFMPAILARGWRSDRVVVGQLTSPENGNGCISLRELRMHLAILDASGVRIGGVMGWEYMNSQPGGRERPWLWAQEITSILGLETPSITSADGVVPVQPLAKNPHVIRDDEDGDQEAPLPVGFDYSTDGSE